METLQQAAAKLKKLKKRQEENSGNKRGGQIDRPKRFLIRTGIYHLRQLSTASHLMFLKKAVI
jgi:hypothetical protein